MSTIADYSVFTKTFLASGMTDFSQLYGNRFQGEKDDGALRAFAVIPFNLNPTLTPREAMNFDWSKLQSPDSQNACMAQRVSCRDADGNFIGNIVRVQPGKRDGSIRFVAKVAVPDFVSSEGGSNPADAPYNTFVLVRTDASTSVDLPVAVATISKGYNLHKHKVVANVNDQFDDKFVDPLDDVENANYVSFTINHLNGYTSVDFNPDAYATYDDVANALSRGIDGLHIAFNSNTGDIILSDSKGNVIDQANLHLDLSADTIIAEGEEGYKYVKTNIKQDIHSAKAFMAPSPGEDGSYTSAFGSSKAVDYDTLYASLVREGLNEGKVCNGIRVRWTEGTVGTETHKDHDDIFCVFLMEGNGSEGTESGKKYLAWYKQQLLKSEGDPISLVLFRTASNTPIEVTNPDSKIYPNQPKFGQCNPVYNHDVFVHTVGNSSLADWDECFKLIGFHDGDDIPLGTLLQDRIQMLSSGDIDPEEFIHGAAYGNAEKVVEQRKFAKEEMAEYNKRRPALTENRQEGTIIDSSGLDVRKGRIILGCGRKGEDGVFKKINYGIQMNDRSESDPIRTRSESLDFTISHIDGTFTFDGNGHAQDLTSSTLLSIESGSYISGAPTCLILAKVTYTTESGTPVFTPVRMTAGFDVTHDYGTSSGLSLTIHDYRDNIIRLLDPDLSTTSVPAIIEVQALYTHRDAHNETVPAQQMHTYIGSWMYVSASDGARKNHPECSFLCSKIEEWMTAIGLTDAQNKDSELYVVIRVY